MRDSESRQEARRFLERQAFCYRAAAREVAEELPALAQVMRAMAERCERKCGGPALRLAA